MKSVKIFSILICLALSWPAAGQAIDVQLSGIRVTENPTHLLLSLQVEGAFNEKMEEAVLNGIPTTFSFLINIARKRTLWTNDPVVTVNVTHTIKYHNLKNHYIIKRSGDSDNPFVTDSFDEAKEIMSRIENMPVVPLRKLKKDHRYIISAKAELDKVRLPFLLNYIFFFASLWDFETEWHTYEFVY